SLQFSIDTLEVGYYQALDMVRDRMREVEKSERAEALRQKPDAELGMPAKRVIDETRWGLPPFRDRLAPGFSSRDVDERWTYDEGRYLYFKNDRLIGIEEGGRLVGTR